MTAPREKRPISLAVPALILVIVLAVYIGSYLMLVNLPSIDHIVREVDGGEVHTMELVDRSYSHGGRAAEIVFWPLEQIDRRLRTGAWGPR